MLHSRVLGEGPDLVMLHGWGMNGAVWDDLAEDLARDHRVWLLDLPGHGHSPYLPQHGSLADWAAACLEAAPAEAVWLGWSLGGSLALEAALAAPIRVRGLCLVTSTPRFVRAPDWPHAMPGETLAHFRDQLASDPAGTLGRFLALQVKDSETARDTLRDLRSRLTKRPPADTLALDAGLDQLRGSDLRPRLGSLAVPSLWLFGSRDALVPWRWSEALPQLMPQARRAVIEGAAHAPFLSHPQQAQALLRTFLQEL